MLACLLQQGPRPSIWPLGDLSTGVFVNDCPRHLLCFREFWGGQEQNEVSSQCCCNMKLFITGKTWSSWNWLMIISQDFCEDHFPSIRGTLQSLHTKRGHPQRLGKHHLHSERPPARLGRCRTRSVQSHSPVEICRRRSEEKSFVLNVSLQYKRWPSLGSKSSEKVPDAVLLVCCIPSLAWRTALYLWWLLMLVIMAYFWSRKCCYQKKAFYAHTGYAYSPLTSWYKQDQRGWKQL